MEQIKSITFKGELEVWGIYNYNKKKEEKYNKKKEKTEYNNHIEAKKFKIKTGETKIIKDKETGEDKKIDITKSIDYTSSRCLRHEIFKDLQPRQPSDKTFSDQFLKMAASEVGLIRGYMSPDDGLKRCSPLHIADAQTVDKVDIIVFDQGSSSKPKEKNKKDEKGKRKSDTSIFSKDNAPYRIQRLQGGINLKELQFLSLYAKDDDFSMIQEKDKVAFLEHLQEYFKSYNMKDALKVKEYMDVGAVYENKRNGILLNQDQIRHLVKVIFQRIKMINGLKAGARLSYKQDSLKVSFFDGENSTDVEESDLVEKLNGMDFYSFFKVA